MLETLSKLPADLFIQLDFVALIYFIHISLMKVLNFKKSYFEQLSAPLYRIKQLFNTNHKDDFMF